MALSGDAPRALERWLLPADRSSHQPRNGEADSTDAWRDYAQRVPSKLTAKESLHRFFMYNESREANPRLLLDKQDPTVEMSPLELVSQLLSPRDGKFVYFTAPLEATWPLAHQEIGAEARAVCAQDDNILDPLPTNVHGSVWLSSLGSGTRAHYDALDNCFVQVAGRKRLRVWEPQEHWAMHPFPDSHPRARKSQIDADDLGNCAAEAASDNERFPFRELLGRPMLEAELLPGDVAQIPAFWFHELETLSSNDQDEATGASVSVNFFSPSPVASLAGRIFASSLPGSVTPEDLPSVIAKLAHKLEITGGKSSRSFLRSILDSRFQPLIFDRSQDFCPIRPQQEKRLLDISLQPWLQKLEGLRSFMGGVGNPNANAVVELVAAHLIELWIVSLTDAQNVPGAISEAADLCQARESF